MARRSTALLFVLGVACAPPREESPSDPPPQATTAARVPFAREPGTRRVQDLRVAWPAKSSIDRATRARLTPESLAKVDASALPVLLPRAGELAERATLVSKPTFLAASMRGRGEHEGLHVSISATKVLHQYAGMPRIPATSTIRGGKAAWVLQNEGIWSATWEEMGVSWVVDLECARPSEDARCASADAITAIVEDLAFVGGSFEGGSR